MKKKRHLKKSVKILTVAAAAVSAGLIYHDYQKHIRAQSDTRSYLASEMEDDLSVEYGSAFDACTLFPANAECQVLQDIDTSQTGVQQMEVCVSAKDAYGETVTMNVSADVTVKDSQAPVISLKEQEQTIYAGSDLSEVNDNVISVSDPVDGDLAQSDQLSEGTYTVGTADTDAPGDQIITVTAEDQHGNQSSRQWTLHVTEPPEYPYYIKVNRAANTVTVYSMDQKGDYSIPYKAFACSTGDDTPLGTYRTSAKYRWHALYGGVYGQYATRIVDAILFHSVPYYAPDPSRLESVEYNKLGTAASMGCVRLCVRDVKWIYDHCPSGTIVEFYDDANNPGPLGKPEAEEIDLSDQRSGWDPTDPDPDNPWN